MNVGPTTTMHSRAVYCFVMAGIFLASLSLRRAVPLEAIPSAGHDDGLFVGLAGNLLAEDWLGSYSHLTLIKGMFYPLFIAVSHVLGLPVKVAEHLAYLGAALLLSAVAGRLIGSRLMVAGLFAVLAFNPFQWMGPQMARVVRDCLYGSLTVAVLALAARAFLVDAEAQRPLAGRSTYLVGLGVALGAFWLTREEREWILPALVLLFAYWLFHRARAWRVAG